MALAVPLFLAAGTAQAEDVITDEQLVGLIAERLIEADAIMEFDDPDFAPMPVGLVAQQLVSPQMIAFRAFDCADRFERRSPDYRQCADRQVEAKIDFSELQIIVIGEGRLSDLDHEAAIFFVGEPERLCCYFVTEALGMPHVHDSARLLMSADAAERVLPLLEDFAERHK